jgi:hypothetical protein
MRSGTVKHSSEMTSKDYLVQHEEMTEAAFLANLVANPGYYILDGKFKSWAGGFPSKERALEAWREWEWERKHG